MAIEAKDPGVIGTSNGFRLSTALDQFMTTMLAHVVEAAQFSVVASAGKHALSLHIGCNIAAGLT